MVESIIEGEYARLSIESCETTTPCSYSAVDFLALSTNNACVRLVPVLQYELPSLTYVAQLSLLLVVYLSVTPKLQSRV